MVPLCQSRHAANTLLHPRDAHTPVAAGTSGRADGEDRKANISTLTFIV